MIQDVATVDAVVASQQAVAKEKGAVCSAPFFKELSFQYTRTGPDPRTQLHCRRNQI
jgi:hypothetical protein